MVDNGNRLQIRYVNKSGTTKITIGWPQTALEYLKRYSRENLKDKDQWEPEIYKDIRKQRISTRFFLLQDAIKASALCEVVISNDKAHNGP